MSPLPGFLFKKIEMRLYDFLYPGQIPPSEARIEAEYRTLDRASPERNLITEVQEGFFTAVRFERGERCFVALHQGRAVSYIWAARGTVSVEEISLAVQPGPSEMYLYDAFTFQPWRGKNLYPAVLRRALEHGREARLQRAMIFVESRNTASCRGVKKAGFILFQTMIYKRLLGVGWPELTPPLEGHPPARFVSIP